MVWLCDNFAGRVFDQVAGFICLLRAVFAAFDCQFQLSGDGGGLSVYQPDFGFCAE